MSGARILPAFGAALIAAGSLAAAAHAQAPPSAAANPIAGQPPERLAATRDRPLFSPTRRPPAIAVPVAVNVALPPPPAPPPRDPPNLALFGIVADGEGVRAVVRAAAGEKVIGVRVGDQIGDWTVKRIDHQHLVLALDERDATFTLFKGENTGQLAGGDPIYRPPGRTVQNVQNVPTPRRPRRPAQPE